MYAKILDFFSTSIGNIYIVNFDEPKLIPTLGMRMQFGEFIFVIKTLSNGTHVYEKGNVKVDAVWSCSLQNPDDPDLIIPIGADLHIVDPKIFRF